MDRKYILIGGIGVLLLILIIVAVFAFSGDSKNNQPTNENIELIWWKPFEDSQNVQELINNYQQLHGNVQIKYVKKDSAEYENELLKAIATGNAPDIFSIHNDWLPAYESIIAPAPESLISPKAYKDNFADVAYNDFVKGNRIYGVPLSIDALALFYNKDILGSAGLFPPTTWPELVNMVPKLTQVSKTGVFAQSGVALGTSENVNRGVDILTLMMLQNGTKFYSDDFTSAEFDQSQEDFNPGVYALTLYTQFANPSKQSYSWNVRNDQSVDAFTQGKLAMMLAYQYLQPLIKAKAPNLGWDTAPVPQISPEVLKVNFANYWGEAVTSAAKNQAAAWDFLNFITSKEELEKYYAKHKVPASRKDILPQQQVDADIGVFAEAIFTAKSVYKKDARIYEGVFKTMIDSVVLNGVPIDDALRNAAEQINLNLRKNE